MKTPSPRNNGLPRGRIFEVCHINAALTQLCNSAATQGSHNQPMTAIRLSTRNYECSITGINQCPVGQIIGTTRILLPSMVTMPSTRLYRSRVKVREPGYRTCECTTQHHTLPLSFTLQASRVCQPRQTKHTFPSISPKADLSSGIQICPRDKQNCYCTDPCCAYQHTTSHAKGRRKRVPNSSLRHD